MPDLLWLCQEPLGLPEVVNYFAGRVFGIWGMYFLVLSSGSLDKVPISTRSWHKKQLAALKVLCFSSEKKV